MIFTNPEIMKETSCKNICDGCVINSISYERSHLVTPNLSIARKIVRDGVLKEYRNDVLIKIYRVEFRDIRYQELQKLEISLSIPTCSSGAVGTHSVFLVAGGGGTGRSVFSDNQYSSTLASLLSHKFIFIKFGYRGFTSKPLTRKYSLHTRSIDLALVYNLINKGNLLQDNLTGGCGMVTLWNGKIVLMGVSMGGYDVTYLSKKLNPDAIILLAPAAYSPEAHNVNFGKGFSQVIRKKGSWEKSDSFGNFSLYPCSYETKNALVIEKSEDEIIPADLVKTYFNVRSDLSEYVITSGNHKKLVWQDVKVSIDFLRRLDLD